VQKKCQWCNEDPTVSESVTFEGQAVLLNIICSVVALLNPGVCVRLTFVINIPEEQSSGVNIKLLKILMVLYTVDNARKHGKAIIRKKITTVSSTLMLRLYKSKI
jgi:hypothetical protein